MLDSERPDDLDVVEAPFARALARLADDRDDVVVVTADLSKWTDVLPFAEAHPDRFVQVGMAEQNLIGVTAGLSKAGWLPVAVTFGVFATRRAYDQIAMSLATRPCRAVIAGFLPGLDSRFRGTHQAIDDLALVCSIPGLTVVDPGDATELEEAVVAAAHHDGVVYVRCSRGRVERLFDPRAHRFTIGPAVSIRDGSGEIGVVATGAGTRWAARAIDTMTTDDVALLHVPTLKPFPTGDVVDFCSRHRRIITVENHLLHGGLGSSVAVAVAEAGLRVDLDRRGIDDRWGCYGTPDHSRRQLGLDTASLAAAFAPRLVGAS